MDNKKLIGFYSFSEGANKEKVIAEIVKAIEDAREKEAAGKVICFPGKIKKEG